MNIVMNPPITFAERMDCAVATDFIVR